MEKKRRETKKVKTTSFYSVNYYKDGVPMYIQTVLIGDKNELIELEYTTDKRFAMKFSKDKASWYAVGLESIYHIKHYTPYNASWDATEFTMGLYKPTENMINCYLKNHIN